MKPFSLCYEQSKQCLIFHIHENISVDLLLKHFFIGRKQRYLYYQHRLIMRNNHIITQSMECQKDDIITISCKQTEVQTLPLWNRELNICYEDALCLIVNKPAGILVHSDGIQKQQTLHNMVQAYYQKQHIDAPVRAIHRLDKDTSGLLFYCKLPFFQAYFDNLLSTKQISRSYLAWVEGIIKRPLTIQKAIARDRHHANKMRISDNGVYAETLIQPIISHNHCTLVECHLKTGRTHQIRVHLASLHHPLLSDPLYGNIHPHAPRLALHAWKLHFYHPLLNKTICVNCSLPEDMPFITISEAALQSYHKK